MKIKEIRIKDTDHLRIELAEQQKNLFVLRTKMVTEKLEDPSQLKKARRGIARMKTILRQRDLKATAPAEGASETKTAEAK
jgi:large subunit ribosomal protein L29